MQHWQRRRQTKHWRKFSFKLKENYYSSIQCNKSYSSVVSPDATKHHLAFQWRIKDTLLSLFTDTSPALALTSALKFHLSFSHLSCKVDDMNVAMSFRIRQASSLVKDAGGVMANCCVLLWKPHGKTWKRALYASCKPRLLLKSIAWELLSRRLYHKLDGIFTLKG